MFSANSQNLVRKVLKMHGAGEVKLIQGDISKIDKAKFPKSISACLLDVDLAVPIYDGLSLVWPLLETGGVIVVDDCYESRGGGGWQALTGYRKFCQEMELDQHFFYGAAYLVKGSAAAEGFPFVEGSVSLTRAQLRYSSAAGEVATTAAAGDRAVVYAEGASTWFPVSVEIARLFADSLNAPGRVIGIVFQHNSGFAAVASELNRDESRLYELIPAYCDICNDVETTL